MPVFIDLTTDFGFKRVFKRKEFMISFLNALLIKYDKPERVKDVTYLNTEDAGDVRKDKRIVFDLKCETQDGDYFIVEMQKRGQVYFDDRIIYYMSRSIATQGDPGDDLWNFGIKKVYGIFLMNFNEKRQLEHNDIRHCGLYDYTNKCEYSDKEDFWLINLPQYRDYKHRDCRTALDKWLYIISNSNKMKTMPFMTEMPVFKGLKTAAEIALMSPAERDTYMWEYDAHRTDLAAYDYAIKEGLEEGLAKGMAEGRAEGRAEEKRTIVYKMKIDGMPIDLIVKYTGLTPDEISKI